MFSEKIGTLSKKIVTFDGELLTIGKKNKIFKSEIKKVFYTLPTSEAGIVYFSKTENVQPISFSDFKKYTVKYGQNDKDKIMDLLKIMGIEYRQTHTKIVPSSVNQTKKRANIMVCPNCGSKNLDSLGNNKKAFSVGKAVGGAVLTGGIGTLAGFTGKKGKTNKWHCKNCGNVFNK